MTLSTTSAALGLLLAGALLGLRSSATAGDAPAQDEGEALTAEERRQQQIERLAQKNEEQRLARRNRNVETLRRMQGTWQLVGFDSSQLREAGRQDVAFLMVAGEFMSIEIHMGYFEDGKGMLARMMQTGTYRLNFNADSELLAQTLIGSLDKGNGFAEFRLPGEVWKYDVDIRGSTLLMISEDSSRFTFERVRTGALTELVYEELDWLPGTARRAAQREAVEASADRSPHGQEPAAESEEGGDEGSPETERPPGS